MDGAIFLRWLAGGLALLSGATIAVNVAVDPYGAFRVVTLPGWNTLKYTERSRVGKSHAFADSDADAVILGNSRPERGLDPRHPAWGVRRAFNLALSGSRITEVRDIFAFASRNRPLRQVLLVADIDLFLCDDPPGVVDESYLPSLFNPHRDPLQCFLTLALSWSASGDSWGTLSRNRRGEIPEFTRGFLITAPPSLTTPQREIFLGPRAEAYFIGKTYFAADDRRPPGIDRFVEIVDECRRRQLPTTVLISPVHARHLEGIRTTGMWPVFEAWKRDLVRATAGGGDAPSIPLFDFTTYAGYCAEDLPAAADMITKMQWWIEVSHYTKPLGDLMLARVLGGWDGRDSANPQAPPFGILLTSDTMEARLQSIRREREEYARRHPDDIREVAAMAERTREMRERVRSRWGVRHDIR